MNFAPTLRLVTVFLALLGSAASHAIGAVEPGYGTRVNASTAGNCPSFCTGGQFANQEGGGSAQTAATASENTYGTAFGSAQFASGQAYLPELKAYAASALGKGANTSSFAAQLFSYTGTGSRHVDLAVDLTGSVSNNDVGYSSNTIGASFAVVRGGFLPWGYSFATLIFEAVNPEDVLAVGFLSLATPGVDAASGLLSFDLAEGDSFFVVGQLDTSSRNGVADASSTLKMSFDNAQNLVAVTAVPEPGAAWLAGSGLLFLMLFRLRRRAS